MMAVNRYRLRSLAKAGHHGAKLAEWLLGQTDKLLSVILLGNNLVNAAAAALVTVISFRLFGESEMALTLGTLIVTFLILVFSEVTPKVIGASFPEKVVPKVSYALAPLLKMLYPVIWFINKLVRAQLYLLRLSPPEGGVSNTMGVEEMRIMLAESGGILPKAHQGILLNLFDLERLTVDDVMRPRSQIEALDLELPRDEVVQRLSAGQHAYLPLCRGELNNVVGIANLRRVLASLRDDDFAVEQLEEGMRPAYFIPSGTPLFTQLGHFQENRQSMGLVVDEYGELVGLVTVEDILEEIVGEFTGSVPLVGRGWQRQKDGSYLVDGSANLRELNRKLGLDLPQDEARTLNGLILEHLEAMPEAGVSFKLADCALEIVQMQDRMVKTVRIHIIQSGTAESLLE